MPYRSPMNSGSVADWVNALGTLLAFGGAAFASAVALRSYRLQLQGTEAQVNALEAADVARRTEFERSQAARVAFWTGVNPAGPAVWYVNQSGLPVYDMAITVFTPGSSCRFNYLALGPSEHEKVLPRVRTGLVATGALDDFDEWRRLLSTRQFLCAAVFRDASNRWWLRNIGGELSPVVGRDQVEDVIAAEADKLALDLSE